MMKKLLASGIALTFIVSLAPSSAFAASTTDMTDLLKQIKELQDKLADLQKDQREVQADLKETVALARELRQGMSGEDVKALQEILAADPELYPEGLVSGYYGPMTARAVERFQRKHGLDAVGNVGPLTRLKLNDLLGDNQFVCKAWGKNIAPGQQKRLGMALFDLDICLNLPKGIADKLGGDWKVEDDDDDDEDEDDDERKDTRKPVIRNIDVDDIRTDSAVIAFNTSERATAVVWYSDDDNELEDGNVEDAEMEKETSFETEFEIELEDLEKSTDYYYIIVATDKAGNTATTSLVRSFETDTL